MPLLATEGGTRVFGGRGKKKNHFRLPSGGSKEVDAIRPAKNSPAQEVEGKEKTPSGRAKNPEISNKEKK